MRIGVVGGGQLGRMLALAGYPLGLSFTFLDPAESPPTHPLGTRLRAPFSPDTIAALRAATDRLTWEFENIPPEALATLQEDPHILPPPRAVAIAQDRLLEKEFFESIGARVPQYAAVHTLEEVGAACSTIGFPAVLKTRRLGYDGKGQVVIAGAEWLAEPENQSAITSLLAMPCIVEEWVPFTRELSAIAARGSDGSIAWYPLTLNSHRRGILFRSSPLPTTDPLSESLTTQARTLMTAAMQALSYVGVMAIEFFERDGSLVVNECAPRVHNSGHWTIEGAITSQFENHLRAIAGLPLGATTPRTPAIAMLNIIGTEPPIAELLSLPSVHPHHYGKAVRPGRKVGHVTITAESEERLAELEAAPIFSKLFQV